MDKVNIYVVLILALLINSYVTCIKENVVLVKTKLQREVMLLTKLKGLEKNGVAAFEKFISLSELDDVLDFVVEISKGIDAFNKIYGTQILGLSAIIMMYITNMCSSILVLDIFLVVLVCGALTVTPCFETKRKFDEIIKVICKLLIELPHGLEDPRYNFVKEKLVLLIKQLEFRKPTWAAVLGVKSYPSVALAIYGVLVVYPCFEATKKVDEVVKVANRLLITLPHGLEDSRYKILKEKLVLLIKLLEFRKP
ncbi:uncharacterized protein LOC108915814, partial [Anoplophora glabripennis]|uniref:uncharacterized protein LOC108915814 n=1 Tax=Anoplophora glabripennis TaxID=217634 RepID=UPI000875307B